MVRTGDGTFSPHALCTGGPGSYEVGEYKAEVYYPCCGLSESLQTETDVRIRSQMMSLALKCSSRESDLRPD